jgi:hypothetical protein
VLHHQVFHGIFTEVGLRLESKCQLLDVVVRYGRVSQPPDRGPVPGPGINYTGPREVNFTLNNIINFW